MPERRTVTVRQWGNSPAGDVDLHVQHRAGTPDHVVDLYLPYAEYVANLQRTPLGAIHGVTLYPDEARRLAFALLELAGVADGAIMWEPSDG